MGWPPTKALSVPFRGMLMAIRPLFTQQIPRATASAKYADREQRNAPPRETLYASLGRRAIFDDMRFLWILVGLGDFDLHQLAVDRIASWRLQFLDAVCSPGQLSELYEAVIISGQRGEQLIGAIIKAELRPRERFIRFGIHLFDHDAGKGIRNEEGPGHPAGFAISNAYAIGLSA